MTDQPKIAPRTGAAIVVALLLWASAFAGIRAGLAGPGHAGYGPGELALLRFGTASLALAAWALVTRMRLPSARDIPIIALAGFIGISVYHVALNFGEQTVSSAAAALIISASPVVTALLSTRFLGEKLTWQGWIGTLVSFAGVAVIALGEGGGLHFDANALLVLIAAVSSSAYMIVSKRPLRSYSGLEYTSYAIWAGTIPLLVFAPGLIRQMPHAPVSATLSGLFLGVFPGAISYVLWSYALSKMPASALAPFLNFQPVNAALIAWLWLGEVPSAITVIGGAVAIAGVVLVQLRGQARAALPAEMLDEETEAGPPPLGDSGSGQ